MKNPPTLTQEQRETFAFTALNAGSKTEAYAQANWDNKGDRYTTNHTHNYTNLKQFPYGKEPSPRTQKPDQAQRIFNAVSGKPNVDRRATWEDIFDDYPVAQLFVGVDAEQIRAIGKHYHKDKKSIPDGSHGIAFVDTKGYIKVIRLDAPIERPTDEYDEDDEPIVSIQKFITIDASPTYIHGTRSEIAITEGAFKAATLSALGFSVVMLGGVSMWSDGTGIKQGSRPNINVELQRLCAGQEVVICFDADRSTNNHVNKQCKQLQNALQLSGARSVRICPSWADDYPESKGIDDLCYAEGKEVALSYLDAVEEQADMYYIPSKDEWTSRLVDIYNKCFPRRYLIAGTWYEGGKAVQVSFDKEIVEICQKLYTSTKNGVVKDFANSKAKFETAGYVIRTMFEETGFSPELMVQNGYFYKGRFTAYDAQKQAQQWSYNPDLEDPTEVIEFFTKCHGDVDKMRAFLYATLDGSIQRGAFFNLIGAAGSGKSTTMAIASCLLNQNDKIMGQVADIFESETSMYKLTAKRLVYTDDCSRPPIEAQRLYNYASWLPMNTRKLFSNNETTLHPCGRVIFGSIYELTQQRPDDGWGRRRKKIVCSKFPGGKELSKQIAELIQDPAYIERIANWVLKMDWKVANDLFDTSPTAEAILDVYRGSPIYNFLDLVLTTDTDSNQQEVSIETLYEGYRAYLSYNGRTFMPKMEDFIHGLDALEILHRHDFAEIRDGRVKEYASLIMVNIHPQALIGHADDMRWVFRGYPNHYFRARQLVEEQEMEVKSVTAIQCQPVVFASLAYRPELQNHPNATESVTKAIKLIRQGQIAILLSDNAADLDVLANFRQVGNDLTSTIDIIVVSNKMGVAKIAAKHSNVSQMGISQLSDKMLQVVAVQ